MMLSMHVLLKSAKMMAFPGPSCCFDSTYFLFTWHPELVSLAHLFFTLVDHFQSNFIILNWVSFVVFVKYPHIFFVLFFFFLVFNIVSWQRKRWWRNLSDFKWIIHFITCPWRALAWLYVFCLLFSILLLLLLLSCLKMPGEQQKS